jgi:hypothetical protein
MTLSPSYKYWPVDGRELFKCCVGFASRIDPNLVGGVLVCPHCRDGRMRWNGSAWERNRGSSEPYLGESS